MRQCVVKCAAQFFVDFCRTKKFLSHKKIFVAQKIEPKVKLWRLWKSRPWLRSTNKTPAGLGTVVVAYASRTMDLGFASPPRCQVLGLCAFAGL
jgi:hypothetical protein